ncbi:MAG: flagellar brake protein [Gammaproteobacteria bacterium]|nr:flagellar brake protein [Gammaproteobacteria bacterium]
MLSFFSTHPSQHHKSASESKITDNACNNFTITNQEKIRKKLIHLHNKNILLSIKVPGKFATSTLLTTITRIENEHIYLGGFQNERFNKDLLMQNTVTVTADFEGIAISFILSDTLGMDIDAIFNIKTPLPQSMEWVQRRNSRRVKVPLNTPVKIQFKNNSGYFNVADISVAGLSYINQTEKSYFANIGDQHTDCKIILPDNSKYPVRIEIVNNTTIPYQSTRQLIRIGCEIKEVSYQLDTALQHLINQIDFYYQ